MSFTQYVVRGNRSRWPTVVETNGSLSAKTAAKGVVDNEGRVVMGWVRGGCAELAVCYSARDDIMNGESAATEIDLGDEVLGTWMPCAGSMSIYVKPVLPKSYLWMREHGRVAEGPCAMSAMMNFEVVLLGRRLARAR